MSPVLVIPEESAFLPTFLGHGVCLGTAPSGTLQKRGRLGTANATEEMCEVGKVVPGKAALPGVGVKCWTVFPASRKNL